MDSQDSSAPPSHPLHHHQQPLYTSHHAAILMGHQHNPIQQHQLQHPSNNSYLLPNNVPTTSAPSNPNMMHQQNPRFPFNSMASATSATQKPLEHQFSDGSLSGSAGGWFSTEPTRKKRGRPRKYSPDNSIGLGLSPAQVVQMSPAVGHVDPGGVGGTLSSETPVKRHRGRPPGSGKKQLDALGIPGVGFTPHVITIDSGEDIASKITAFSQQGPRTVCILSANGAIKDITLHQPALSGVARFEGQYEIISLSGSFPTSDSNGSQTCTLSVSAAGKDGKVLGGGVAGVLEAASTVQVVVGSFVAEGKKIKGGLSSNPPSNMLNFCTPGNAQASGGGSSDSGDENDDSPLAPSSGPYGNAGHAVQNLPIYSNMGWSNSIKM